MCTPLSCSAHHPCPRMQQYIDPLGIIQSCHTNDIALWPCWIRPSFRSRLEPLCIDTTWYMYNPLSAKSVRGKIGTAACAKNLVECVRFAQKVQHLLAQWQ